ncbi:MAG: hypothetical protein QXI19_14735 [Candidatus Caldarchaeum sp.]
MGLTSRFLGFALVCFAELWAIFSPSPLLAREMVAVGVIEADGVLKPIATYEGSVWRRVEIEGICSGREGEGVEGLWERVWGVEGMEKEWKVYPLSKAGSMVLSTVARYVLAGEPVFSSWGCLRGFRTDYDGSVPTTSSIEEGVYAPLGVAFVGESLVLSPMRRVGRYSKDYKAIYRLLEGDLDGMETEAISRLRERFGEGFERGGRLFGTLPPQSGERGGLRLELEGLYASLAPVGGKKYFYFEALRSYRPLREYTQCHVFSRFFGWLVKAGDGHLRYAKRDASIGSCNVQADGAYIFPMALVYVGEKAVFFAERISEDGYHYMLLDPP